MDTFIHAFDQPKLNQEDINHLNRSIKAMKLKKIPGPSGFIAEFYQIFKEELVPPPLNLP
jgi:hypothetical protein